MAAGLPLCAHVVTSASAATGGAAPPPAPALTAPPSAAPSAPSGEYAVGERVVQITDPRRRVRIGGALVRRVLTTVVRYPAQGAAGGPDVLGAAPFKPIAPFPLIVFAHGFAVGQATYARLLDSWARAGFVVAAPEFPLTSPGVPGGPDESDVVNQPSDVSVVISALLALDASSIDPLAGLIDPAKIAVAGHSDGAETALAAAYSRRFRDPRVKACVVMSGAELSGIGGYSFGAGGPPLLAVQGTADHFNEPRYTYAYFRAARRPKFLLRLLGAGHLPPYTTQQPQLAVVERSTLAFLQLYLGAGAAASAPAGLRAAADVPAVSKLVAEP